MSAIKVQNITKAYSLYASKKDKLLEAISPKGKSRHQDFLALKDISFSIEHGECVGIIGLNGSGKSTLLKIITGVIAQTSGKVDVNGKISALLELGAGFNPEYTGMENIYLNSTIMGYSKEEMEERLPKILEFADIGDFINQPVKKYSSGMFVRLAFAIAINVEPDILIIDEALSVGDVFFQQKCFQKIREMTGKATVLIVSHDLNAITKFCHRVLVLNNGELIFDGAPQEAVTRYFKIRQGTYNVKSRENIRNSGNISLDKYKKPDVEQLSGHMGAVITGYYYLINGRENVEICEAGDSMHVSMIVEAKTDIDNLIVGYQVRDKYGNEVFGQTSITSNVEPYSLKQGINRVDFDVVWPEVREGDYFITLGVGNGFEVLNQVEECWINGAIHLIATTYGKTIFGIFNQEMEDFHVEKLD